MSSGELLQRFPRLALDPQRPPGFRGWEFRAPRGSTSRSLDRRAGLRPASAAPAGVKPAGALPNLDQDFLRDLFGLRHITYHGADRAEYRRSDAPTDGLEGVPVALGDLKQQHWQLGLADTRAGLS